MLQNNTVSKLHDMKRSAMAKSFQNQMNDSTIAKLGFEDRFSILVDTNTNPRLIIAQDTFLLTRKQSFFVNGF